MYLADKLVTESYDLMQIKDNIRVISCVARKHIATPQCTVSRNSRQTRIYRGKGSNYNIRVVPYYLASQPEFIPPNVDSSDATSLKSLSITWIPDTPVFLFKINISLFIHRIKYSIDKPSRFIWQKITNSIKWLIKPQLNVIVWFMMRLKTVW